MKKILLLLSFIALTSFLIFKMSTHKADEKLSSSFYFWESDFNEKNSEDKLYIKVLDINYSQKLEIIKTSFLQKAPKNFVPTIYITNKTLQNVDFTVLSNAILKSLDEFNFVYDELQIDCDWSLSTKSNYFNLLNELKSKLNKTMSATIRLHQIKYSSKTGIPPVDYGLLMYYNMSDLGNFETKNSILDNDIAKQYHYNFDSYSLKLKLALPLYSQAVLFRDKKALALFEGAKSSDFTEEFKDNFIKLAENKFQVKNSFYYKGKYIYKDDILRLEEVDETQLKIALNDFLKLTKNRFNEVVFYTLKYKNSYNLDKLLQN